MKVNDLAYEIVKLNKGGLNYEKVVSLLHRTKKHDKPNWATLNGLFKMDLILDDVKDFVNEFDFSTITKSKWGGRGEDKSKRKPHGSVKRKQEEKQKEHDDYWNRQQELGDGSWVTPPNM